MSNDVILVYDINALPDQLEFEKMMHLFETRKVVIWDSIGYNGEKTIPEPKVYSAMGDVEVKLIDTKKLNKGEIHRLINSFTNGK